MFHVPAHKAPLAGIPPAGQIAFDPRLALVPKAPPKAGSNLAGSLYLSEYRNDRRAYP